MRFFILMALAGALFVTSAVGQEKPDSQELNLTAQNFHKRVTQSLDYQYLLFLPRDYAAKADKRWPLILFLHGAGERGSDVWKANLHGPGKFIARHPEFPFVVVSPVCPAGRVWSVKILTALLDETVKKYRIDTNRLYLTGLSMGGFGAWDLALSDPARFAAVIPIAGGGSDGAMILTRVGYATPEYAAALRSLPVWAFHGGKDPVVPLDEAERMIAALKSIGAAEVKLTVYPEAGHDSWAKTYDNPEIYDWLLQHKR